MTNLSSLLSHASPTNLTPSWSASWRRKDSDLLDMNGKRMSRDPIYQKLLNSPRWMEVKRQVWQRASGQCERCKREGYVTAGVDCHHKIPVESAKTEQEMKRLAYDWQSNIELLCVPCHIKTHQEMRSHTKEKVKENKARARRRFMEANDPNYEANNGDEEGSKGRG